MSEAARASGEGWAAANLDELGAGPGFRKVRRALGVSAFGVNAVVLPPGVRTGWHWHERQQELYFLHAGEAEIEFGDGRLLRLRPGDAVRVDAATRRRIANVGDGDVVYLCAGGEGGYVGRDGRAVEGEQRVSAGG